MRTPADWMRLLDLRFPDAAMEAEFRDDYYRRALTPIRAGITLAIMLYAAFGILDTSMIPNARGAAWLIRFVVVIPLGAATLALTYSAGFQRHWQAALMLAGYVGSLGVVAMCALGQSPGNYLYYAGLLLAIMFIFTAFQLPFLPASCLAWATFFTYSIMALWIAPIPAVVFFNNIFFFIAFIFTGMWVSYTLERYRRLDFCQRCTIRQQTEQLQTALAEIDARRAQAEEAAARDPLTGLFNRRRLYTHAVGGAAQYAILLLDLDYFKKVNDTFGHAVGDEALAAIGQAIAAAIRATDTAFRYGGEEFAILLPDTDLEAAAAVGQRLLNCIRELPFSTRRGPLQLTTSIGLALSAPGDCDRSAVIDRADRALYAAKQAGRDRLEVFIGMAQEDWGR